jgi:hypothetical protein
MNNRNLQLSLFHLHAIVKDLATIINALGEDTPLSLDLFIPIHKYIIIRTCAFYDEFENQFLKHSKSNEVRFIKLEKIYRFVLSKRNNYFPDIYNMRNYALAHNYRIKTGSIYNSIFEQQLHFTIPKSAAEISINIHLMDNFLSAVKWLYPEIYEIMEENLLFPTENTGLDIVDENGYPNVLTEITNEIQRLADESI